MPARLTLVARAYDRDGTTLMAQISRDDAGTLYVRKRPHGRKWEAIHPTLNPTLAAYAANLEGNFGWKVETL